MERKIVKNTKENILDVARNLFAEYTYLCVSMDDIASKLNITKPALYYHFKGKKELYKEILGRVFKELETEIFKAVNQAKDPKAKLCQLINSYLKYGQKEKFLVKSLFLCFAKIDTSLKNEIIKFWNNLNFSLQKIFEEIFSNKQKDVKAIASLFISIMNGLLLEQSLNDKFNLEEITKRVATILEVEKK